MNISVSRREALAGLAGAGLAAAAAAHAAQSDPGGQNLDNRLTRVLDLVERANTRMHSIVADWGPPPEPDRPGLVVLLQSIIAECDDIAFQAEFLISTP
jgi:hypothetical protein